MKIGNINGAKGVYAPEDESVEATYEIHSVDGGMEKNQDADVTLTVDGVAWRVSYTSDSRSCTIESLTRDGVKMPVEEWADYHWGLIIASREAEYVRPAWVPEWAETVEPGPNGLSDLVWFCVENAIQKIEREAGREPKEDATSYSISKGEVYVYSEDDAD